MMYLLRGSVPGRLVGVFAAGIKCRPYLDSMLTTQMVKLVTARSLGNCMTSDSPVGRLNLDNTGRQNEIDVPSFFTDLNTQKNIVPVRIPKIDNSRRHKKHIDFPDFFTKIEAQVKTHHHKKRIYDQMDDEEPKKICYGPVFTGEVEMRYLEYLDKLPDWKSLMNHVRCYPRRRSENEKRLIFEKWASHCGRKYPSAELKEMRFTSFKRSLAFIDETHSKYRGTLGLKLPLNSDVLLEREFFDKWDGEFRVGDKKIMDGFDKWDSEFRVGNKKIVDGQKNIYFPYFFTKMKAIPKPDRGMRRIYGPVFTGEVEKRYLEYLKKLDWDSLQKHITDFPRRRSHDEKWLIFDKWTSHYGKVYPCTDDDDEEKEYSYDDACKGHVFGIFEERLEYIDNVNSKHHEGLTLGLDSDAVPEDAESKEIPYRTSYTYSVEHIPYDSVTPHIFCELTDTVDNLNYHYGIEVCFPI